MFEKYFPASIATLSPAPNNNSSSSSSDDNDDYNDTRLPAELRRVIIMLEWLQVKELGVVNKCVLMKPLCSMLDKLNQGLISGNSYPFVVLISSFSFDGV